MLVDVVRIPLGVVCVDYIGAVTQMEVQFREVSVMEAS